MKWDFPDGLRVEQARPRDALPILALHRDVLDEQKWFITLPSEFSGTLDDTTERIRDLHSSDNSCMLVARLDRELVGFATVYGGVHARLRHCGKIEIMVARHHRGRGIGRRVMESLLEWATANPLVEKLGLSVFSDNERALHIYRTMGFVEEGRRCGEYRMEDGTLRGDVLLYRMVPSS